MPDLAITEEKEVGGYYWAETSHEQKLMHPARGFGETKGIAILAEQHREASIIVLHRKLTR